ncbi:acyltransferase family protein [Paraburkholderia sp.]|uniref:acyltransferase family protein n=1 Tax=Paraburkholderia sp. TaxID=1926495 RepID=UPI003D6DED98
MRQTPRVSAPDASVALSSRPKLNALTSLRFFAAFGILALHYRDMLGPLPNWLLGTLVAGEYGVTFFFVLSGFILTYNYVDWFRDGVSESRFWRFSRLRFARIYPLYMVGLLLDAPWHLFERFQSGQLASSGGELWASWLLNLVGLQAWVPATPYAMVFNTPSWSLSTEFFFYATFPFVLHWLIRHLRTERALIVTFIAAVIGSTAIYMGVVYWLYYLLKVQVLTGYMVISYNPLLRYAEFFAGCLTGLYFRNISGSGKHPLSFMFSTTARRNVTIACCLALSVYRAWHPNYSGPSAVLWILDNAVRYSWFIGPFALVIIAIASGPTMLTRVLEMPLFVLLGESSYALYITHWSGVSFLKLVLPGSGVGLHLLFMAASVPVSVGLFLYVECPMRRWLTQRREYEEVGGFSKV